MSEATTKRELGDDWDTAMMEAEIERLQDLVRFCRRSMRELDVEGHLEQSWPDFCADTERLIKGINVAKAAGGKHE